MTFLCGAERETLSTDSPSTPVRWHLIRCAPRGGLLASGRDEAASKTRLCHCLSSALPRRFLVRWLRVTDLYRGEQVPGLSGVRISLLRGITFKFSMPLSCWRGTLRGGAEKEARWAEAWVPPTCVGSEMPQRPFPCGGRFANLFEAVLGLS